MFRHGLPSMKTALFTHADCLAHQVPEGSPEIPARLAGVLQALEADAFAELIRLAAPPASDADITLIHPAEFWTLICGLEPPEPGPFVELTFDAHLHTGTIMAARRCVGGALAAMRGVARGDFETAFVATRPPGHHAEPQAAMGFCYAATAAIAAAAAIAEGYASKAAVIDFDVHHGNGTQAAFWDRADLFYGSIHKSPLYPGTGRASETGAHGNIANAPFGQISAGEWRDLFETKILAPARAFAPDYLIVSAGFDAHRDDPLGAGPLEEADFAWATERLVSLARETASGRLVSVMEGGYDLDALARSAAAHVRALLDA